MRDRIDAECAEDNRVLGTSAMFRFGPSYPVSTLDAKRANCRRVRQIQSSIAVGDARQMEMSLRGSSLPLRPESYRRFQIPITSRFLTPLESEGSRFVLAGTVRR